MKKIILLIILTILFILPIRSNAVFEDHPNYTNINTLVQNIITVIQNHQAEFFTVYQRYFQGLRVPEIGEDQYGELLEADKLDGIRTEKINITIKPDDIDETWGDFDRNTFKVNLRLPVHISVNVVQDPEGNWGWVFTAEFWYSGIDPDEFGHSGNHWLFHHSEGLPPRVGWIYDVWFCRSDEGQF